MKTKKRDVLRELDKLTYVVEHCPNCPKMFLVRLPGNNQGVIDKKPYSNGETKDILGFGRTLRGAAKRALAQRRRR